MQTRDLDEIAKAFGEDYKQADLKKMLQTTKSADISHLKPKTRLKAEISDDLTQDLSIEEREFADSKLEPISSELVSQIASFKKTLPKGRSVRFYKRAIQRKFGIVEY